MSTKNSNLMDFPNEYFTIQVPKRKIADAIRQRVKEQNLTFKEASQFIEDLNYSQFSRVTCGANYTIDTLLKALAGLDLEIEIKKKKD